MIPRRVAGFALCLSVLVACGTDPTPVNTLPDDVKREVIAAVIESEVLTLLDPSKDKAPVLWRDWWYTVVDNLGEPSPAVLARFRQARFDVDHPPPRPANDVDHRYQVRRARYLDSGMLEADVGPPFFGCVYRFTKTHDGWVVAPTAPGQCWIS